MIVSPDRTLQPCVCTNVRLVVWAVKRTHAIASITGHHGRKPLRSSPICVPLLSAFLSYLAVHVYHSFITLTPSSTPSPWSTGMKPSPNRAATTLLVLFWTTCPSSVCQAPRAERVVAGSLLLDVCGSKSVSRVCMSGASRGGFSVRQGWTHCASDKPTHSLSTRSLRMRLLSFSTEHL